MRWSTSPAPCQWGRSNGMTATPGSAARQRGHARVVRAVATADEQRRLVQPEGVAALHRRGGLELPEDRNAGLDEVRRHGVHLAAPSFLARPQEERAVVGHERRVEDVDRIRGHRESASARDDLGAVGREQLAERLVLLGDLRGIGRVAPAERAPGHDRLGRRRAHEDAAQRRRHRHAAVLELVAGGGHACDRTRPRTAGTLAAWGQPLASRVSRPAAAAPRSTRPPAWESCSPASARAAPTTCSSG